MILSPHSNEVFPILFDSKGVFVWYVSVDNKRALYLDNGTGAYPGTKIYDLPNREESEGESKL